MIKHLALSLVLVATACAGSKPEATTPAAAAPAMLELGDLKLVDVNKNKAVTIQADGTIVMPNADGDAKLKVTGDGKLMNADQLVLRLMPDGTVQGPDGTPLAVTLSADGVLATGDQKISVDDSGTLLGGNPDAPQMRVEGATTPGLKRTALFVLMVLLGVGTPAAPPPPVG